MKLRVLMYAGAMLITGSINTIAVKFQDMAVVDVKPDGTAVLFQHPAVQSMCMFIGESLCLVPYFLLRWRRRVIKAQQGIPSKPKPPTSFFVRRTLAFAVPTLCDATATTLLNVGLFYTFASTYQMLRGTLVLFTGLFTILVLRRTLYLHHWLGLVLITAGAAIVGAASILCPNTPANTPAPTPSGHHSGGHHTLDTEGASMHTLDHTSAAGGIITGLTQLHWPGLYAGGQVQGRPNLCGALPAESRGPLFGNAMVVLAQGFTALQFILEEKFLGTYRMQPLLAVGIEGAWGVALCLAALPVLSLVKTKDGMPIDDAAEAVRAMWEVPSLRYAVLVSICSIGLFNFFGLSVTAALSGASRATIDACRTILVWAFSITAGWESFKQLQVVGFLVLLSGTSLYNELIRSCLPQAASYRRVRSADDVNSGDEDEMISSCSEAGDSGDEGGPDRDACGGAGDEEKGNVVFLPGGPPVDGALGGDGGAPDTRPRTTRASRSQGTPGQGGGLQEPLLAADRAAVDGAGAPVADGRTGRDRTNRPHRQQSHAQRIEKQGGQHTPYTMARSMRLGFRALSPHDLAESDDDSILAAETPDVANPMMLAATPHFPGYAMGAGLRAMVSDGVSSASGASPRASASDLDDYLRGQGSNSSIGQGPPAWGVAPSFSQGIGPGVAAGPAAPAPAVTAVVTGPAAGSGAGKGGAAGGSIAAALRAGRGQRSAEPPPQGGFMAFMAQREREKQGGDGSGGDSGAGGAPQ